MRIYNYKPALKRVCGEGKRWGKKKVRNTENRLRRSNIGLIRVPASKTTKKRKGTMVVPERTTAPYSLFTALTASNVCPRTGHSEVPQRKHTRSLRNIPKASVFNDYVVPKLYVEQHYRVSCTIHNKEVKNHSHEEQRDQIPPHLFRPADNAP